MCFILFAWRVHPRYPLIFAGNRDESYNRPSATPDFWSDAPEGFGGRDLEQGGTWLGVTCSGRIAAVTNYRERPVPSGTYRSRGELTARYLRGSEEPLSYLEGVASAATQYRAFSLLLGHRERFYYYSNRAPATGAGSGLQELTPGVHGLSNHLLDTPWPKVVQGKARLAKLLNAGESEVVAGLYEILLDRTPGTDAELPDTGVGRVRERELSASFVAGDRYGTRASTVMLIDSAGAVFFSERAFGPLGAPLGVTNKRFTLERRLAPAATSR